MPGDPIQPRFKGHVDGIDNHHIFGWAMENGNADPISVTLSYKGKDQAIVADRYRHDLEAAGYAKGCCAFRAVLPCDPAQLKIGDLKISFPDGSPLRQSQAFREWKPGAAPRRARHVGEIDLLASPVTRVFHLEFTSRCNLRCTYCEVSQPDYKGEDMDLTDFEALAAMLKKRRVETLAVNGHGETTMIPGWDRRVMALAKMGFRMSIISNFAHLMKEEELEAMAHIAFIEVSVDTHDPEKLRRIRRKVDLGNILINMTAVRAKARELGLHEPVFSWSCVLYDQVAMDFLDYVRFALAAGVRNFSVCNLVKNPDIKDIENVQHVTTLPDDKLKRFADMFEEAKDLVLQSGGDFCIHDGLPDTLQQELEMRGIA